MWSRAVIIDLDAGLPTHAPADYRAASHASHPGSAWCAAGGPRSGQRGQGLLTPLGQQVAMDAVLGSNLVERLLFLEHLADKLGFEGRTVVFTHSGDAL